MLRRAAAQLWAQGGQGAAGAGGLLRGPAAAAAAAPLGGGAGTAAAALGLARPFSGSAKETLSEAAHRLRSIAERSASAVKAAGSAAARAPDALYRALPTSAQQLVNAAQTPGAVNRVISLQLTAFWHNHHNAIIAAAAAGTCYATWRLLLAASGVFVDVEGTAAAPTLLALSASAVAFGYLYLRRRYTIDPAAVYRLAMYRLNTHPGLLEVMGAPLVGSPVQASVLTGGSIRFRGVRPKVQSKRLQMIFPLKGAERRGLVSLEAKKRHGQLRFKLLAVDVPCAAGGEQRIFLEGGPSLYERGGVLSVLRDPFIRALSMEEAFLAEDEAEDAAEERERAAAASAAAATAAAKQPKPMDQGGGLYFWEKVELGAKQRWAKWAKQAGGGPAPLAPTVGGAAAEKQEQPVAAARAA
ncbi:hypothetical protein ABPG75_008002 [Micractinium tetrahymenae]